VAKLTETELRKTKQVESVDVLLDYLKDTPGTHRYQERDIPIPDRKGAYKPKVIRSMYIEKWVIAEKFGGVPPKTILVTIHADD
jgi:hypothetical protein